MPLENFILIKKSRGTIIISERGSSVTRHSCVTIAACNKQLPARLAIAGRPHVVARLH